MDPRARCDVVTLLPPLDDGAPAPLLGDAPAGAPTVAVVVYASVAWRFRDVRVTVDAPWTVDLAAARAREVAPSLVVALVRGDDGVTPAVARALAAAEAPRRLCLITPPAARSEAWETLVERDLRERVTASGAGGDELELRWLPADPRAATDAWRAALDALCLPSPAEAPAATEGRLALRACGCVVSANVRLAEGAFPGEVFDAPFAPRGEAIRANEAPFTYVGDDGPWIYLHPDDVRGLRVARGTAHGCCGWYPVPGPILRCTAHGARVAWGCSECSSPWYAALRERDVTFTSLRDPGEPDPVDEDVWDGEG